MRLIDADSFELNVQSEWERSEISNGDWMLIRQLINEEPTIDAVEVVRCRECKYGKYEFVDNKDWIYCKYHNDYWTADDFCGYGERRKE